MFLWILAAILLLGGAALLAREILALGEAKRRGAEMLPHYGRFRRRAKGLVVLGLLFVSAILFEPLSRAAAFDARLAFLYFLGAIVLLIWLLIITTRDMKATAIEAMAERQTMAADLVQEVMSRARDAGTAEREAGSPPGPPPPGNDDDDARRPE